jgi:6-pyruvoyltetrahydropterin/6-carboxytetrahydropterin synthase
MSRPRIEICKEFSFEAAHHLAVNVPAGHPYSRLHGHSFKVEIFIRGTPDPGTGWIMDFAAVDAAIAPVRDRLDHHYLNDIPGLAVPTLETLGGWIWEQLRPALPGLRRVVVHRGSCGQSCVYEREEDDATG